MGVAVGIGLMDCPFQSANEFWSWVDRCEDSPLDSIWQTDRLISPESAKPSFVLGARHERT